jgi:peptidoglycan/xylan/chitin deacetylase (PgdA/CDA1 family)
MVGGIRGARPARFVAGLLVLAGCVGSVGEPPGLAIEVAGRTVRSSQPLTVGEALRRADVVVPAGHVLSARTRRPLPGNHQPGEVLLDGVPAAEDTVVLPGAVLTVVPGRDVTEPVRVVTEPVLPTGGAASLYVGGRPGKARVVQGVLSGETVSRTVLTSPHRGRLVAPKALALTFDDGPDPRWTPQVLRWLAGYHVHATFCLVGRHVAAHPELVRAIVRGGHALCNHTWSHDEDLGRRSPDVIRGEIARTQQAIYAAAGVRPRLFRAPGGGWTSALVTEAHLQGLTPLRWDVDPRDWSRPGALRIYNRVMARARAGDVILLHDGYGNRSQTVWALRALLYRMRQLHDVLALPQP